MSCGEYQQIEEEDDDGDEEDIFFRRAWPGQPRPITKDARSSNNPLLDPWLFRRKGESWQWKLRARHSRRTIMPGHRSRLQHLRRPRQATMLFRCSSAATMTSATMGANDRSHFYISSQLPRNKLSPSEWPSLYVSSGIHGLLCIDKCCITASVTI